MAASPVASHTGAASKAQDTDQSMHLRVFSDAAFKRESEDGYSLRGSLVSSMPWGAQECCGHDLLHEQSGHNACD